MDVALRKNVSTGNDIGRRRGHAEAASSGIQSTRSGHVGVSRPLSGPLPGQARNNIEDTVISGMLMSEFIGYRGLRYRIHPAVISRVPISHPILTLISEAL